MIIDIISLFPEMFDGPFAHSIIKRAQDKNLVEISIHNLRRWAIDERGTVDDRSYGGGPGMVLRPEPLFLAVEDIRSLRKIDKSCTVLLTPQGEVLKQKIVQELSNLKHLILICGHYEGVDERVRQNLVDREISIGDYILTGGELPSMVLADAITRLLPGVLEKPEATDLESFSNEPLKLEYPQYTRPADFRGLKVPEILLSGDHESVNKWRQEMAEKITSTKRPELK